MFGGGPSTPEPLPASPPPADPPVIDVDETARRRRARESQRLSRAALRIEDGQASGSQGPTTGISIPGA